MAMTIYKQIVLLAAIFLPGMTIAQPQNSVRLTTQEITRTFSNVLDSAQVQDSVGTSANNLWYGDGRLINNWSNEDASGQVTGQWYARDNLRCVVILTGIPEALGRAKCGPIYRQGDTYISLNKDGSVHGVHRLTPMKTTQ